MKITKPIKSQKKSVSTKSVKQSKSIINPKNILIAMIALVVVLVLGSALTTQAANEHSSNKKVCAEGTDLEAGCFSRVKINRGGTPITTVSTPVGYGPTQLRTAYGVNTPSTSLTTIAIVDAYDHPSIKADLDVYNSTYKLPFFPNCSSTVTTSCFMKVNQTGGTKYPKANAGWALEIAMDVEVAHGICPTCKLILVEATSASYTNLAAAVDRARLLGATVISNSYGSNEFATETAYDSTYNYPGIAFLFSSGDNGYGATYPAASRYVTAVGGTSLYLNSDNTRQTESVWTGAGSGCSAYESKPAFQKDTGCANRTVADVSAVADPNTGAAVYDSVVLQGQKGWFQVGGTSLSAPLVAGIYGLAGNVPSSVYANSLPYTAVAGSLYDVASGTNGVCGGNVYLCSGVVGFDGPSGLGSPIGLGAF